MHTNNRDAVTSRDIEIPPINNETNEENRGESGGYNEEREIQRQPSDESIDIIKDEEEDDRPLPVLNPARRFSLGRIPVPPMQVTVEDIQEAAQQSREMPEEGTRKLVDPRRSSVSLEVFKSFKDPAENKKSVNRGQFIHIETKGVFRAVRKNKFRLNMLDSEASESAENNEEKKEVVPGTFFDIAKAYRAQKTINQVALIVQGFLAGISVTLAVFSFNFGAETLLKGYKYMSMPIHAAFVIAFTIGFVTAIDRTGVYKTQHFLSTKHFKNMNMVSLFVWGAGTIATLLCIKFDAVFYYETNPIVSDELLTFWRVCSVIRAISAGIGWLLLAFKPNSDVVAAQLKMGLMEAIKHETKDLERKEAILKALKMTEFD